MERADGGLVRVRQLRMVLGGLGAEEKVIETGAGIVRDVAEYVEIGRRYLNRRDLACALIEASRSRSRGRVRGLV